MNNHGNFGKLKDNYTEGRKNFPSEIFEHLEKLASKIEGKLVLDIGCGTGIATRQLQERGAKVIGVDIDALMIEEAKKLSENIGYYISPADNLPFEDHKFDAVTAFSSFHWFATKNSIEEIKRVLKPGGILFVVNKNDAGDLLDKYKKLVSKLADREIPDIKKNYSPLEIISSHDFHNVSRTEFESKENYTMDQAVKYLQSTNIWNLVPEEKLDLAKQELHRMLQSQLSNNVITKNINIIAISGTH